MTRYCLGKPIPGPRMDTAGSRKVSQVPTLQEQSPRRPPSRSPEGGQVLWLTISPTRSGPGRRCSEPASQVRTSRAAGSLATSPGPGETCAHRWPVGGRLWTIPLGCLEPGVGGSSGEQGCVPSCGALLCRGGQGCLQLWLLPTLLRIWGDLVHP